MVRVLAIGPVVLRSGHWSADGHVRIFSMIGDGFMR